MPELHLRPQAEKDLRRIGPGPERARLLAGLRRLGEEAPNLDIKAILGAPGWRRLRIGTYRVCYRSAPTVTSNGDLATAYVIARIVHRRDCATGPGSRLSGQSRGYVPGRVERTVVCSSWTRHRRSRRGPRWSSGCGMRTPQPDQLCGWYCWAQPRCWSSVG